MTLSRHAALAGRVAVITGASRGIGEAIARAFAERGAKLVVAARKPEALEAVAESLRSTGAEAIAVPTHTGDPESAKALVAKATEHFGAVDIVVNNAATNPHYGAFLDATEEMWDKTFDINVKGYFRLIQAAAPAMLERKWGRIINVASIAGLQAQPGMGVYGCSKAAVLMMTQALAVELASSGVTVNAIAPGFVKTKFSSVLWQTPQVYDRLIEAIPARRMAEPKEIAGIAAYLASEDAAFTTGAVFEIDGGQRAASGVRLG
jgi:NAD(P)-dependent dehydrogenase (short-subunit alcohol dehydrogenase family)